MGAYFAMRVMTKKDTDGLEAAQAYYRQVFSIATYKPYKEATDAILVADGYGDCIVTIA
ncbi:MAG: hypothetical protein N3B21_19250 [Clostridia bacterium]|nr:hypothetical protein [Clostridia bacterium]